MSSFLYTSSSVHLITEDLIRYDECVLSAGSSDWLLDVVVVGFHTRTSTKRMHQVHGQTVTRTCVETLRLSSINQEMTSFWRGKALLMSRLLLDVQRRVIFVHEQRGRWMRKRERERIASLSITL